MPARVQTQKAERYTKLPAISAQTSREIVTGSYIATLSDG